MTNIRAFYTLSSTRQFHAPVTVYHSAQTVRCKKDGTRSSDVVTEPQRVYPCDLCVHDRNASTEVGCIEVWQPITEMMDSIVASISLYTAFFALLLASVNNDL